ncbi:MAG: hypothetical protein AAF517_17190, partial [Planctomycetota bacterium]
DVVAVLQFLFLGHRGACRIASDVNASGQVDLGDPIFLLDFLFRGGPAPPGPYGECVEAEEPGDDLDCRASCV